MTRALFITTLTSDCDNHVRAWNSFSPVKAVHHSFNHCGLNTDWRILEVAREVRPEVIFYIGAHSAPGNPKLDAFKALRTVAPTISICSDAGDKPWHRVLEFCRSERAFDLQVSIDGAKDAPVDLATLTPVDPRPFAVDVRRDIRAGFSGSVGRFTPRSEIIKSLIWFGGLEIRDRGSANAYEDHARYMKRCRILLNMSFTGTGLAHHIKGRVLEAGWAGCCLLESEGSPIAQWFPEGCWITYRDPPHAVHLMKSLDDATIERVAGRLASEVRTRFSAGQIYGEMLRYLDRTKSLSAA